MPKFGNKFYKTWANQFYNYPGMTKVMCPDQEAGEIINNGGQWSLNRNNIILDRLGNPGIYKNRFIDHSNIAPNDYVILILESPHIDEFHTSNG